jgi:hypothetical protein
MPSDGLLAKLRQIKERQRTLSRVHDAPDLQQTHAFEVLSASNITADRVG